MRWEEVEKLEKLKLEKKKKAGLRRCLGHWPAHLRNSRFKKNFQKEESQIKDCYDSNGKCEICGGYQNVKETK